MKKLLLLVSVTAAFAVVAAEIVPSRQVGSLPKAAQSMPPPFATPEVMQAEFVRRFEASPGFGLSRVVRPIFLAPTPALVHDGTTYTVTPPELVALEDEAVVYAPREHASLGRGILTNAPRREVRRLFTHRALTALETNVVAALRAGSDLIVMTNHIAQPEAAVQFFTPPDLLVYGALRASKSCAECHQCDPGTLLGAFAYKLAPMPSPTGVMTNPSPILSGLYRPGSR